MLELRHISKRFAGVVALDDVNARFASGMITGLLGENGAGKSTVMQIACGLLRADDGEVVVQGQRLPPGSARAARAAGLGLVHQHSALAPALDTVANAALLLGSGFASMERTTWKRRLDAAAETLAWRWLAEVPVGTLSAAERQRAEILIALAGGSRCLVLDEPTAVLTPSEADALLAALTALAAAGRCVVLITHKLREVEQVCAEVVIMRHGRVVHAGPRAGLDQAHMAELMVGTAPMAPPPRHPTQLGTALVEADDLDLGVRLRVPELRVRRGEIVGIAGVSGNGQDELVAALRGRLTPRSGRLALSTAHIGYIPGDRHRDALIGAWSLRDNLLLRDRRQAPYTRMGWRNLGAWTRQARALIAAQHIRTTGPQQPVARLSGGNQQKAVLARELAGDPDLLIAVNPTRGLDVAASHAVMVRLAEARDRGAGVLLVHSDLDEVLAWSDRVLVAAGGRLHATTWPDSTRDAIGQRMLSSGV